MEAEKALKAELAGTKDRLAKSEAQIAKLQAEVANVLSKPIRKAITGIGGNQRVAAPQVNGMSLDEIRSRLNKAVRRSDLSKSDRAAINRFVLAPGAVKIEEIKHLLGA